MRSLSAFVLVLAAGPVAMATCPFCGGDHAGVTPPSSTVSTSAGQARQEADQRMQEYQRKVGAARAQASRPAPAGGAAAAPAPVAEIREAASSLARARQEQVVREYAAQVLKSREERPQEQKPQDRQAGGGSPFPQARADPATAVAALNGQEAGREEKRNVSGLTQPKPGSTLEQVRWVAEASAEAAGASTDEKPKAGAGRGIDSPFPLPVYAGDAPERPAGVSLMDLFRKKESQMREDYLKRAEKVIEEDKERQRKVENGN